MNAIHINTMREILAHPEPVDISLFTAKGEVQHYRNCISLRYDFRNGTRRIKLLSSGQIRQVRDVCIFQINCRYKKMAIIGFIARFFTIQISEMLQEYRMF